MGTRAVHPVAQRLLGWMQQHPDRLRPDRLRDLLDEEAEGADDLGPAGDPAVRAHLRFVAEALAVHAAGAGRASLEALAAGLPAALAARESRLDEEMRRVGEAAAFEVDRQFGSGAGEDPSVHEMVDRRVRIEAWIRVFLDALDAARAPADPVAPRALAWMAAHTTRLADTIFAMDRRAKEAEMARGGPDAVASPAVVNRIGQASTVQAHMRFLVEGLAESL